MFWKKEQVLYSDIAVAMLVYTTQDINVYMSLINIVF